MIPSRHSYALDRIAKSLPELTDQELSWLSAELARIKTLIVTLQLSREDETIIASVT